MAEVFYQKGKKYNCIKNGTPYFRKSAVINGKQRSFYGDGEKDAIRKIEEAKAREHEGLDYDKRAVTVGAAFHQWLFNIKRIDSKVSSTTFSGYAITYKLRLQDTAFAAVKLSKVSLGVLQAHINQLYERGDSRIVISHFLILFGQFCKYAMIEGYLAKNPCTGVVIPGEREKKKEVEVFTEQERATLLAYLNQNDCWYAPLIKLAFATGMRKGELLALRWEDIENSEIHVRHSAKTYTEYDSEGNKIARVKELGSTKTINSERTIPLLPATVEMLKEHHLAQKKYMLSHGYPQSEMVFTTHKGTPIGTAIIDDWYKRTLKMIGLPYKKFHAIRHTFATEAIKRGVPVKDVQMLLGHSDIMTTYIYVHATKESTKHAIELMGAMM